MAVARTVAYGPAPAIRRPGTIFRNDSAPPGGSVGRRWYTLTVLLELRVENLLLIERAELRLGPGLNVLTGETGAGKTVLAHALDLLLGGRARPGIVRPGSAEAYVEGVFALPDALRSELGERLPADAEDVVLARRVSAEGRTRALLNGRSVNVADLRAIAEPLIAFYGQHEHRRLTLASAQLEVLDGFCGPDQARRRARAAAAHARVHGLEGRLDALGERAGARERELDLLDFELGEIEGADPRPAEEDALTAERGRLRHLDGLRAAALGAVAAATGEAEGAEDGWSSAGAGLAGEGPGIAGLLAGAAGALDAVGGVDAALDALVVRWRAVALEVDDLAGELRAYAAALEAEPGRLDAVEDRLAVLGRLTRKHGGSVAAVLAHAEACRRRREELCGAGEALDAAQAELAGAREDLAGAAAALRAARRAAAGDLAERVRAGLAELAMEGAAFAVELHEREPGPTGGDAVEFTIAANPGVPPAPLREIASGGELSRVMLALMTAGVSGTPGGAGVAPGGAGRLLVFDEVDAGIGGQTARAVGAQLRALARERQVLCITHLPQVASLADRHFSITKDPKALPARTSVLELAADDVVGELVRMLGAEAGDGAARRHARELLRAA